MLVPVLLASVFAAVVLLVWGVSLVVAQAPVREQQKIVAHRVESLARARRRAFAPGRSIFKTENAGAWPAVERLLLQVPRLSGLPRALRQADWSISPAAFLLLSGAVGVAIYFGGRLIWGATVLPVVFAAGGLVLPYVYLSWRRRKRFDKFLAQFPDALDLIGRSVRAGHAIAAGFEMVANEMESPIADEFRQTYEEQKFGLAINEALLNLQERVPLLEVRILGTALAIQREVGGNLAEVLDNISHTVRERFKLLRQIRVYTAQGRLTGYVLAAMPLFMGFMLLALNPRYFQVLLNHAFGVYLLGMAALFQLVGYFWIRKIINIRI